MLALARGLGRGGHQGALGQLVRAAATASGAKPVAEKEFLVYRWSPDSSEPPKYQTYKVDINKCARAGGRGVGGGDGRGRR